MKSLLAAAVLGLATLAHAAPPAGNEAVIQPDETFPWVCEFYVTLSNSVAPLVTVSVLQGTDPSPPSSSLVTGAAFYPTHPSQVLWTWTPVNKTGTSSTSSTVYWIHIVA